MIKNFKQITDFLSKRVDDQTCPSCKKNSRWSIEYIYKDNEEELTGVFTLSIGKLPENEEALEISSSYMFGRPVIPLVCTNCAYIKLYDYKVMNRNMQSEGKTNPQGDE